MKCPRCEGEMIPTIRRSQTDAEKAVNPWTQCGWYCESCEIEEMLKR